MIWVILGVYAAAKLLGALALHAGIPALVGEILGGVALGNLHLLGIDYPITQELLKSEFFRYAAELGVIFLLFQVGLESNLSDLVKSGFNSLSTALIGVFLPTATGYLAATLLGLGNGLQALLVGAAFAATSVGITAKLLTEVGKLKTPSAQIILGAAVIDDVLGLMLLAVLAGIAGTGSFALGGLLVIILKISVFFGAALLAGHFILPQTFRVYRYLDQPGMHTVVAVMVALLFANLSTLAGLAPIIGAFTAGLLLDEVRLRHAPNNLTVHRLEEVTKPIVDFLLPVFFVSIGVQIQLQSLFNVKSLVLILTLTIIAVIGKGVSGFFCRGNGFDKLGIGLGMVPRGEVGLIFVAFGLQQGIINTDLYAILVSVVLLTTVLGPVLLKSRVKYF